MSRFGGSAGKLLAPAVAGLCQYEVAAILSRGKIAPLTAVSRSHKWLAPVLVTGLAVHLYLDAWRAEADAAPVPEKAGGGHG